MKRKTETKIVNRETKRLVVGGVGLTREELLTLTIRSMHSRNPRPCFGPLPKAWGSR